MVSSLGPAIPMMADRFGVSKTNLGSLFTSRGIGYLCGTLVSTKIEKYASSKRVAVCAFVCLSGIATGCALLCPNIPSLAFLLFLQGTGYGGIDTYANAVRTYIYTHMINQNSIVLFTYPSHYNYITITTFIPPTYRLAFTRLS